MKKKNRRLMLSLGSVMSISLVSVGIVSCATNPNNGITPSGKDAYTIYFKDGTSKSVTYDQFMEYLRDHEGTNTTQQVQYDNQVIKWLYKDEQAASVTAHEKDSTVPALTSYDDVYDNANKKLEDAKKAIKTQYGTDWEPEWAKALLSSQYGGALSEAEAKEYLAVQTMKADALKRFTLKIDTSTYKADDIDNDQYPFLVSANKADASHGENAIEDNNSKNAITLITSSYNNDYKYPDTLLKTYMDRYANEKGSATPTYNKGISNIRHVLYSLKAGVTPKDPWTLSTDSIKKLYGQLQGTTPPTPPDENENVIYKKLKDLGSNVADNQQWGVEALPSDSQKSLVGKIVSGNSDNDAAAKTYGSLGMSTLYDDVKTLSPGFVIPIAVGNSDPAKIPQITPTTLAPTYDPTAPAPAFDLNAALIAGNSSGGPWTDTSKPSEDSNIQNDITTILGNAENLKKTLDSLKAQLSNDGTRPFEYTLDGGTGVTTPTQAVFSADGLHMIYQEKLAYDSAKAEGGLNTWVMNDLYNTRDSNSVIYNVIKSVNEKMAPTDNFSDIYDMLGETPTYSGAEKFDTFVKSQKNYANDNNSKFTDANITQAKNISNMLKQSAKDTDIQEVQKKYLEWWNKTIITEELIDPSGLKWSNISDMLWTFGGGTQ